MQRYVPEFDKRWSGSRPLVKEQHLKKIWEFTNWTDKNRKGVCDAACMTWLSRIDRRGLRYAMELTPEECDELQASCEASKSSYAWTLTTMLAKESKFDASGHVAIEIDAVQNLRTHDFLYAVVGSEMIGHAMAIYKSLQGILFFNPGEGIFHVPAHEAKNLIDHIKNSEYYGKMSSFRKGALSGRAIHSPHFYGG